mmetsp:Transcript_71759/g.123304  ORF Transcript_71759/g.123304 Transcript_71759/m.123304 type:complete len:99 (-) Transcript_71759:243-539(-)
MMPSLPSMVTSAPRDAVAGSSSSSSSGMYSHLFKKQRREHFLVFLLLLGRSMDTAEKKAKPEIYFKKAEGSRTGALSPQFSSRIHVPNSQRQKQEKTE